MTGESSDEEVTDGVADAPTFAEPWQARAFALAVSLADEEANEARTDGTSSDAAGYGWHEFQRELVAEIDAHDLDLDERAIRAPDEPTVLAADEERYYRQWLSALEHLLTSDGALDETALRERALEFERGDRDAHEFVDGDPHAHAERLSEGHADGGDAGHSHDHHGRDRGRSDEPADHDDSR